MPTILPTESQPSSTPAQPAGQPPAAADAAGCPASPGAGAPRRVALVTGASKRLGRDIALELARHGFDVAVHHRLAVDADALSTVDALRRAGARAHAFVAELADEAACRALLPAVAARFGRVDVVVNNAATFEYDVPSTFGFTAMETHWRANTAAAVLLAQALHDHLAAPAATAAGATADHARSETTDAAQAASGAGAAADAAATAPTSGCVVNLLDQKLWNPNPDYFSYTLSKAALQAATVMLAQALAPRVRVCAVAPGITLPSGPMSEAAFGRAHALTPLGRSSTPADIARAVRFLAESPAITGSTLLVDGGQHLQPQPRDVLFLAAG